MKGTKGIKLLLVLAVIMWFPVAFKLWEWGGSDVWQQTFMLTGVPRHTILNYHQFPFWNPWASGGVPHLAHPNSLFLSPSFTFALTFGPVAGAKFRVLLVLWAGFCGSYLLGRRLAPGYFAPYICAFVYMLSSWYPLYMSQWHTEFVPFAYLPWLLLFYHMGREKIRWCVAGGVVIALTIFEGGVYPLTYALLFLALYVLLDTIFSRQFFCISVFSLIVLLGFAIGAIKLTPMLDFVLRNPRQIFWQEPVLPWCALPRIFLGRDQLSEANVPGGVLGWWEYGAYVGLLPLLFAFAAPFVRPRKAIPLAIPALFFFWLMFGDYGTLSAWHWLRKLPLFSFLHDPIRFRVVVVFCLAIMSAMTVSRLEELANSIHVKKGTILKLVFGMVTVFMLVDLVLVSGPIYSRLSTRAPSVTKRSGEFRQTSLSERERHGASSFICFLRNEGLINNADGLYLPPADLRAHSDPDYMGEVWLGHGAGHVETLLWSPNLLSYKLKLTNPDVLIVNQRYNPGWRAFDGRPVHSRNGILAVEVAPPDSKVSLYYVPRLFYLGCVLSLVGLLLGLFVWRKG